MSMEWSQRMVGAVPHRVLTRPEVAGIPVSGLVRYALFGLFLVAILMFYVWSRVAVRSVAADLDLAVRDLEVLQVDRDRLRLELAMRHDLARVETAALALGLEGDLEVVEVPTP